MRSKKDCLRDGLAPTVQQGADFIERCVTDEYKLKCIESWREKFGDGLADGINAELMARESKKVKK
ncbi:hypothetical protein [Nitrosomonas ureae]|uniref:Uncharacterized protein n=1 Tax=Nitrosomonas ureae TaxID=44577 RepID=A0A1H2EQJ6_9PROT|nr:hypothetical protein [Nitrosomonas ureae]SDT97008.1 hypothetical protein SAMN05216406_11454 [Nitrosomonas ureae]